MSMIRSRNLLTRKLGLDTVRHEALSEASEFVKAVVKRISLKIVRVEEIAFSMSYLDKDRLKTYIRIWY